MSWQSRAQRALVLFEGSADEHEDRTWRICNHILDESNDDFYVSRDFFNVQQTAGGLPEGVSFDDFLGMVGGHIRPELEADSFSDELPDEDFKAAMLTFDDAIRRHMRFLNGTVHAGAPGEVHVALWDLILNSRADDRSVYSVYRDFIVDA